MLVVHTALLTPYVRVSSYLKRTTTGKKKRKVAGNYLATKWLAMRNSSLRINRTRQRLQQKLPLRQRPCQSQRQRKAEKTALLLGFISRDSVS